MKKWKCVVCGYVHVGQSPPEQCPVCRVSAKRFEEVKTSGGKPPTSRY